MDFQSAMETFAEAWVAANSQPAPKLCSLTLSPASNNNNVSSESNNNHNHSHQGTGTGARTEPSGANSMDSGSYSQKCDIAMDSCAATAVKNSSMTSPAKNSENPHANTPPPQPASRALSPPGVGMDLSPPNRRSRLPSSASSSPALLKRSSKPVSAPLTHTHAHASSRQASPCLGKSIPIHCIVEVLRETTDSVKKGLVINNNNNWDFGKHDKNKEQPAFVPASGQDGNCDSGEPGTNTKSKGTNLNPDEEEGKVREEVEGEDHSAAGSDEDSRGEATDEHDGHDFKSLPHAKPCFVTEVDDFVIIPSHTRFHDVVATVLTLLGYSQPSIRRATGTISLRNWKPLHLHQVCEPGDEDKTVGDIFNDLTHHAVLRIQIQDQRSKRGNLCTAVAAGVNSTLMGTGSPEDLKEKLLRLLLRQSSSASAAAGGTARKDYANAQSQSHANEDADVDENADGGVGADEVAPNAKEDPSAPPWLLEDVNRRFDLWYASQHQHTIAGLVHSLLQQQDRDGRQRRSASAHLSESSNESLDNDTSTSNHTQRKRRSSSSSWSSERERERARDRDRDKEMRRPRDRGSPATATTNGNCNLLNGPLHQASSSSSLALTDKQSSLVDKQDKGKEAPGDNASASSLYRNSLHAIAGSARQQSIPSPSSLPATLPHEEHGASAKMGLPLTMQDIINHRQSHSSQVGPTATPNFFLDECTNELLAAAAAAAQAATGRGHGHGLGGPGTGLNHDFLRRGGVGSGPSDAPLSMPMHRQHQHQHPVFHNFASQKTRMRTSFDPEMELPKLQSWFQENPHPSRQQIQQYVRELNLLDCRKDRKPLDVNNVIYWFKNARAAQKRNEMRYNGLGTIQGAGAAAGAGRQHQRSPLLSPFSTSMVPFQQQQHGSPNDMLRRHYLDPRDGGDEDCSEEEEDFLQLQQQHQRERERRARERSRSRSRSRSASPLSKRPQIKEEYEDGCGSGGPMPVKVELSEGGGMATAGLTNGAGKRSESSPASPCTGEPKDLTNDKSGTHAKDRRRTSSASAVGVDIDPLDDDRASNLSVSNSPTASLSPRSCSPVSTGHQFLYGRERERDDPLPNSSMSPPASASAAAAAAAAAMLNRFYPFFDHPSFLAYHRHLNSLHFGTGGGGGGLAPGSPLENGPAQAQAAAYEQAVAAMASAQQRNGKSQSPGSGTGIFDRRPGGGPERERGNPADMFHDLPHNLLGNLRSPTMTQRQNPYANLFGPPPTSASGVGSPPLAAHGGGGCQSRASLISPPGRLGVSGPSAELFSSIINSSAARHGHGLGHEGNHPNHILGLPNPHQHQQQSPGGGGPGSHQQQHHGHGSNHHSRTSPTLVLSSAALDERRKRNRTFIDPVTEVPRLEQWFILNTHPSHNLILKYTDELNRMPYRQKFPRLEPKNVQFWFKNRRAKCKRLKMTM